MRWSTLSGILIVFQALLNLLCGKPEIGGDLLDEDEEGESVRWPCPDFSTSIKES
jgi:hypothetical protein